GQVARDAGIAGDTIEVVVQAQRPALRAVDLADAGADLVGDHHAPERRILEAIQEPGSRHGDWSRCGEQKQGDACSAQHAGHAAWPPWAKHAMDPPRVAGARRPWRVRLRPKETRRVCKGGGCVSTGNPAVQATESHGSSYPLTLPSSSPWM